MLQKNNCTFSVQEVSRLEVNMRFSFSVEPCDTIRKQHVVYIENELITQPCGDSDYSIMLGCGYLGLDISLGNNAVDGISGYCPLDCIEHKPISFSRSAINAKLGITFATPPISGTGCYLCSKTIRHYDSGNGILSMSFCYDECITGAERLYRIMENVYIELSCGIISRMFVILE